MSRHGETAPGTAEERDPGTRDFVLNQTMLRIRDPEASLDFYTRVLGMTLIRRIDVPQGEFSLYFLGYPDPEQLAAMPEDARARSEWLFAQPALLELTHNWGTESDPEVRYHDGNSEPRASATSASRSRTCTRPANGSSRWGSSSSSGRTYGMMKGLAFIRDPDGYWIEILSPSNMRF
ncbi:MAG: lactoylglutathione lyase [Gammaproteobacteria bacterium]|nr:lactoylglutathione lyase [Gammaproteobacteria bacterium]